MRLLKQLLLSASLGLMAMSAGASPASPKSGVDFLTLDKAQQTESGKKVEVTEFFWYNCPHCNAFEPSLAAWVKKQGDNIVFKRVPIAFNESFVPQQRMYYALEALGKTEDLHQKLFAAIHVERQRLDKEGPITDFVVKQGVDKQKFLEMYNSFTIQSKVQRASKMQQDYKIDGVPTIAIGGRFVTSPSIAAAGLPPNQPEPELNAATLQVMDSLVAGVRKEHGNQAKPATASAPAKAKAPAKAY
jgi:thiol:disulfide interchange protein DsbA